MIGHLSFIMLFKNFVCLPACVCVSVSSCHRRRVLSSIRFFHTCSTYVFWRRNPPLAQTAKLKGVEQCTFSCFRCIKDKHEWHRLPRVKWRRAESQPTGTSLFSEQKCERNCLLLPNPFFSRNFAVYTLGPVLHAPLLKPFLFFCLSNFFSIIIFFFWNHHLIVLWFLCLII